VGLGVLVSWSAVLADAPAERCGWSFGVARAQITPKAPFWMAGFAARTRPAEGVLDDLWVKALVLESAAGERGVVVSADILGFPKGLYDSLCRRLLELRGLRRDQLLLAASHTHSGPVLRDALYDIYPLDDEQRRRIEAYTSWLEKVVIDVVLKALEERKPCTLWAGVGKAGFAVNRRTNREADLAGLLQRGGVPNGPSDHRVPVLAVRSPGGELEAVVFGYAAHASALNLKEHGYEYSADYPGSASRALEEAYPGAQAMFFQGCGSDQSAAPRGSLERCIAMGRELGAAVRAVIEKPMRPVGSRLSTQLELVRLDYEPVQRGLLEQTARESVAYSARWARRLLGELDEGRSFSGVYPEYPVQVWSLGSDQLWIALGGEVAVDYALHFARAYGEETWVAGYSNDVMAYIPSARIREEGGYQAGAFPVYGLPALRWSADIEERIDASVARLVERTRERSPATR
jgi:hypothetical protein